MGEGMENNVNKGKKVLLNDKIAIFNFLKRVNITMIITITMIIIFVYLFIYIPMGQELQSSLTNNLIEHGHINYHSVESSVQRAREGATSLSSRTMIKTAIEEYYKGNMTLDDLKLYTLEKYNDGAKALNNVIYAERIVKGNSIAKYNISNSFIPKYNKIDIKSLVAPVIDFNIEESIVIIYSPIVINSETVGFDYVLYTLSNQLDLLCTNGLMVDLINAEEYNEIFDKSKVVKIGNDMILLEAENDFYVISNMEGIYFYTKQGKVDLFKPLTEVTSRIFIGSIAISITFLLAMYIFIIRYAQGEIKILEESRKEFRTIAYIDQLTGAYSRRYLEVWNSTYKIIDEEYAIVMVDVDNFKGINDVYGHSTGDLVLKTIAETVMNHSRQSDIVVRFGGDEFLLILPSANTINAKELMIRIEKNIGSLEILPIPISISYGISDFTGHDTFEKYIKEADQLMYENKTGKKVKESEKAL